MAMGGKGFGKATRTQPAASRPMGVRPAPGPGQDMTPALLRERWGSGRRTSVVDFYGHDWHQGDWACFSNFYQSCPFNFILPSEFDGVGLAQAERATQCTFSEKAIMLCKAAIMGDYRSYMAIRGASSPAEAKRLGRSVQNFQEELWTALVCSVAFEAVNQKFSKTPTLQPLLLATGDKMMCEATQRDRFWGIGIDTGDPRCQNPSQWRGTNILGWALMEVRSVLRAGIPTPEQAAPSGSSSTAGAASSSQPSALLQHEKDFLKCCKVVRDILKLEEQNSAGKKLAANQEQKLKKKSAALKDVRDLLENFASDSALRQKNEDVIQIAMSEEDTDLPSDQ